MAYITDLAQKKLHPDERALSYSHFLVSSDNRVIRNTRQGPSNYTFNVFGVLT